jgi:hypothetical protein
LAESEHGERVNGLRPPGDIIVANFYAILGDIVSLIPKNRKGARTLIVQTLEVHVEENQHLANIALTSSAFHILWPGLDAEEQLASVVS